MDCAPTQWPPAGAEEVDVESLYDRLAEAGYGYGPAFQGVQAAWRRGEEVFVEVALDDARADEAGRFVVHPALLDAALHGLYLLDEVGDGEGLGGSGVALPFTLSGVEPHGGGESALRVALTREEGGTVALTAFQQAGEPVLTVESLVPRPVEVGALQRSRPRGHESLQRLEWVEVACPPPAEGGPRRVVQLDGLALAGVEGERCADLAALIDAVANGAPAPDVVFARAPVENAGGAGNAEDAVAAAARGATVRMLELLQGWLACPVLASARLVLLMSEAVAVAHEQAPDLAAAAVWGLLRSAQSEHPGRFTVIDHDNDHGVGVDGESDGGWGAGRRESEDVGWLGLLGADEPQLAVRRGRVLAPRLVGLEGGEALLAPAGEERWHLGSSGKRTLDDLALLPSPRRGRRSAPARCASRCARAA